MSQNFPSTTFFSARSPFAELRELVLRPKSTRFYSEAAKVEERKKREEKSEKKRKKWKKLR